LLVPDQQKALLLHRDAFRPGMFMVRAEICIPGVLLDLPASPNVADEVDAIIGGVPVCTGVIH
jgi:hypothetical protein